MPSAATVRTETSPIISIAAPTGRHPAGFTLLELLIVMAIMAVVAGISLAVGGRSLGTDKPEVVAQDIAQHLRRARSRAIADNIDRALYLDVEAKQLRVDGDTPRPLPARLDLDLLTATSERQARNVGSIRFYPDGSSTGGEIAVADATQAFIVRVEWLTGDVEIVRAPPPDRPRR
jgi:general secretion pathway protein H